MQRICCGIIGCELVDELKETINIVQHRRGLADAVELAKEKFMLIAVKTRMQSTAKFRPLHGFQFLGNRLDPAFRRPSELHAGTLNLDRGINRVHVKIIFRTCDPQLKVSAIKRGKMQFGELAGGIVGYIRWAIVRQNQIISSTV